MAGLEVDRVCFSHGRRRILDGISFDAFKGEVLGILGQNGSGKTTLLNCIRAEYRPESGKVTLVDLSQDLVGFMGSVDVRELSEHERSQVMAIVEQNSSMNFPFTVMEVVRMGRYSRVGLLDEGSESETEAVCAAMEATGVLEFSDRDVDELSGGEWRRVMIAQALAQEPEILLLDEPTLHLDINHQFDLMDLCRGIASERGMLVAVVTHDLQLAARYCDRIIVMKDGRIESMGSPEDVVTPDMIRRVFGMRARVEHDDEIGGLSVTLIGRDRGERRAWLLRRAACREHRFARHLFYYHFNDTFNPCPPYSRQMTDLCKPGEGAMDAWTDGSKPVKDLIEFVSRVTDPGSGSFVPEEDRVAVFDMDGTILSENHPGDLEWAMYLRRVLHDPGFVPDDRQKALAEEMMEVIRTGVKTPGFTERKNECNAAAFRGMTLEDYEAYVDMYLDEVSGTYTNARRKDLFYAPMLQLMDYLSRMGFSVFVCSATETMNVRRTIAGLPGVNPGSAIATEYELEATGQNGADSIGYVMGPEEDLVYSGRIITVASGMNKVARIVQVVGKRPILAFGNGSGDYSMLTYVSENPHHDSMSFILCADDSARDYGNVERTAQFKEYAERMGWGVISMKDDFKRIYADGIVPKFKNVYDFFARERSAFRSP